jgi:hypothetical protein
MFVHKSQKGIITSKAYLFIIPYKCITDHSTQIYQIIIFLFIYKCSLHSHFSIILTLTNNRCTSFKMSPRYLPQYCFWSFQIYLNTFIVLSLNSDQACSKWHLRTCASLLDLIKSNLLLPFHLCFHCFRGIFSFSLNIIGFPVFPYVAIDVSSDNKAKCSIIFHRHLNIFSAVICSTKESRIAIICFILTRNLYL